MASILTSIHLLDENKKSVDGIIVATDADEGKPQGGVEADFDSDEPEDVDSLPPLTEAGIREAQDKLAEVFGAALQIDMSQPVTVEHELLVAKALVDVAALAMEDPRIAGKLPRVCFLQINPCPPVGLDRAFERLAGIVEPSTLQSVKAMFSSPKPTVGATHGTQNARPV